MKAQFLLLIILISKLVQAQATFYNCPVWKKKQFTAKAQLVNDVTHNKYLDVQSGDDIVFKDERYYDCSGTGHEGVTALFYWTIPKDIKTFNLQIEKSDSLIPANVSYSTSCGPPVKFYNYYMKSGYGTIEGKQLEDGKWSIMGRIKMIIFNDFNNASEEREILLDGIYELWKQPKKYKKLKAHPLFGF
jgi:hypothetical protein